ncbi:hypothetical protein E2562_036042 [Oryza meyeriana var. granulata]|uniref:Uncharacterized protein n=1 Tax=Oryza meyeriana var. granulata TaxID=110450 RepID=A0A6G1DAD9_9ORYZ|nr:hypothetical protein E2562_036042 [Oryza meyeriana var. granulata]
MGDGSSPRGNSPWRRFWVEKGKPTGRGAVRRHSAPGPGEDCWPGLNSAGRETKMVVLEFGGVPV